MKIYIPYFHTFNEGTCNCSCWEDECSQQEPDFDEKIRPAFKKAHVSRETAVGVLGRHIITDKLFKEFYQNLIDIRDRTYLKKIGEDYHLDSFVKRCEGISDNGSGFTEEFGQDFIDLVMKRVHPKHKIDFKVEQLKVTCYTDYRNYGMKYSITQIEAMIRDGHPDVRLEDIEKFINWNASEILKTCSRRLSDLTKYLKPGWEKKINAVENYEEFKDIFYEDAIADYEDFDNWVDENTCFGVGEYEL